MALIGEEFISYFESNQGQYNPVVSISKYDGSVAYRDMIREDLVRILDDQNMPGGWLFRKTFSGSSSWVKRFALLRSDFIFLFHSPQNEKPISVIPLNECKISLPDKNGKSFDALRSYRANEGYEFDISHNTRATARFYTLTNEERTEWVSAVQKAIKKSTTVISSVVKSNRGGGSGNIKVTSLKLSGYSLTSANLQSTGQKGANPYAPAPYSRSPYNHGGFDSNTSVSSDQFSTSTDGRYAGGMPFQHSMVPQDTPNPHRLGAGGYSPSHQPFTQGPGIDSSPIMGSPPPFYQSPPPYSPMDGGAYPPLPTSPMPNDDTSMNSYHLHGGEDTSSFPTGPKVIGSGGYRRRESTKLVKGTAGMLKLEGALQRKISEQLEARRRETIIRQKLSSRESILEERAKEELNPLVLSEMFRVSLFFYDEELVEDPQPETPIQIPHLKGDAVESMMITIYQRYCGKSGFMSLEQFVEFMDDCAVLQTHAPRDENDEPTEDFKAQLDAIRLLSLVPRAYGNDSYTASSDGFCAINEKLLQAYKHDKFLVNFTQFYQIILKIAQITYTDLYKEDMTLAVNKILQEVVCPLFVWSRGRHKRGSTDVLVLEERILLLLVTYSPNLWKVFLMYATDAVGKHPPVNQPYPENAQANEKGLFKLPPAAPLKHRDRPVNSDSIVMTEAGCQKFAADYGLTPHLVSVKQMKEIYRNANRTKCIVSSRLPARDQLPANKMHSPAQKHLSQMAAESKTFHIGRARIPSVWVPVDKKAQKAGGQSSVGNKALQKGRIGGDMSIPEGEEDEDENEDDVPPPPPPPAGPPPPDEDYDGDEGEEGKNRGGGSDGEESAPPPPPPLLPTHANVPSIGGISIGLGFSEFVEVVARVAVEGMEQENYHILFPTPFAKVLAILTYWGVADLRKLEETQIVHTESIY